MSETSTRLEPDLEDGLEIPLMPAPPPIWLPVLVFVLPGTLLTTPFATLAAGLQNLCGPSNLGATSHLPGGMAPFVAVCLGASVLAPLLVYRLEAFWLSRTRRLGLAMLSTWVALCIATFGSSMLAGLGWQPLGDLAGGAVAYVMVMGFYGLPLSLVGLLPFLVLELILQRSRR